MIMFFSHRLVRLTSPSLNYVIIGGVLVMYCSVILYVVPVTTQVANTALCNVSIAIEQMGLCSFWLLLLSSEWFIAFLLYRWGQGCLALATVFALGQYWLRHGECITSSQTLHQRERYCLQKSEWDAYKLFFLQAIRDWHLGIIIAAITLVDLVLLGLAAALPHALNPAQYIRNQEHPFEEKGVSTKDVIIIIQNLHILMVACMGFQKCCLYK